MERLQGLCSRQECCSRDIFAKALKSLEGDENAASEVVAALVRDRFVDDLRYACAFCREKSSLTGWGPHKIRFALRAKGIEDTMIDEALDGIDSDTASDKLSRLLRTKSKSLQGDPQIKLKLIRFALTRGYEYSQVEEALSGLEAEGENC